MGAGKVVRDVTVLLSLSTRADRHVSKRGLRCIVLQDVSWFYFCATFVGAFIVFRTSLHALSKIAHHSVLGLLS